MKGEKNEVFTHTAHEDCLLAVHRGVSVHWGRSHEVVSVHAG
jgi:hypothetical protein